MNPSFQQSSIYDGETLVYYNTLSNCTGPILWVVTSTCSAVQSSFSVKIVSQPPPGDYIFQQIYPDPTCSGNVFLSESDGIPMSGGYFPLNTCLYDNPGSDLSTSIYSAVNSTSYSVQSGYSCNVTGTTYGNLGCFNNGAQNWYALSFVNLTNPVPPNNTTTTGACNNAANDGSIFTPFYLLLLFLIVSQFVVLNLFSD